MEKNVFISVKNNTKVSSKLTAHSDEMGKKGVCISRENLLAALHHLVGWLVGCTEQARVEKVGDAKKVPELSSSQHRKESGSFKRIHPF